MSTGISTDTEVPSPASRRLAVEHAREVSEQADRHAVTLESILAILRSSRLDDRAARNLAIDIASTSLVGLRMATDQQQTSMLEPVVGAFAR
ncbi:MAG: hypothetical protein QOK08_2345, partial [Actinomycetota bacterium]|nr:hypothetical protein [Actinomycetota bacterium]